MVRSNCGLFQPANNHSPNQARGGQWFELNSHNSSGALKPGATGSNARSSSIRRGYESAHPHMLLVKRGSFLAIVPIDHPFP